MAHLVISNNESRANLVNTTARYLKDLNNSHDEFEKEENGRFIETIMRFCLCRGGFNYWYDVLKDAKNVRI